jgi:transcriptional regulator with XRE-family HTH domain
MSSDVADADTLDLRAIGEALATARRAAKRSQNDVAKATGICQPVISFIERGMSPSVPADTLHRLAAELGLALTIAPRFRCTKHEPTAAAS